VRSEAHRLADIIEQDPTTTWGYREASHAAAAELRRFHAELVESERWRDRDEVRAENAERERDIAEAQCKELGAALRRLISYCFTLENRLMDADGEHPALQQAKEALAKVEQKA
jgi:hypothetical protein